MTDNFAICQLCPGELSAKKWSTTKCCDVVAHHDHFVDAARNSTLISWWTGVSKNGVHLDRIPFSCPACYSTIKLTSVKAPHIHHRRLVERRNS